MQRLTGIIPEINSSWFFWSHLKTNQSLLFIDWLILLEYVYNLYPIQSGPSFGRKFKDS